MGSFILQYMFIFTLGAPDKILAKRKHRCHWQATVQQSVSTVSNYVKCDDPISHRPFSIRRRAAHGKTEFVSFPMHGGWLASLLENKFYVDAEMYYIFYSFYAFDAGALLFLLLLCCSRSNTCACNQYPDPDVFDCGWIDKLLGPFERTSIHYLSRQVFSIAHAACTHARMHAAAQCLALLTLRVQTICNCVRGTTERK